MSTTEEAGGGRAQRRAFHRASAFAALIGIATILVGTSATAGVISTTHYSFSTQNQSLTAPGAANVTVLPFALPIGGSIVPRATQGEIRRVNVSGIDNGAAQAAYDTALSTCTSQSVAGVNPTAAECRAGRVMRGCTPIGCVINVDIPNLDGGLGDRPPDTVSKSFDVGMRATYEATLGATLQGELVLAGGGGEGDVSYSGTGVVTSSIEKASAGERVTLSTAATGESAAIESVFGPSIQGSMDLVTNLRMLFEVEAAAPNVSTGEQLRETFTIVDITSNGPQTTELIDFQLSFAGFELGIGGGAPFGIAPKVPIPIPGVSVPGTATLPFDLTLPVADVALFAPDLDTPVNGDFAGEATSGKVVKNADGTLKSVSNSAGPGGRAQVTGPGAFDAAVRDTDYLRVDIDQDFFATLATRFPFGVNATFGPCLVPNPTTGGCSLRLPLLTAEGNLLDWDIFNFFSLGTELTFEPRLTVDLMFSEPLMVETAPGSNAYEEVLSRRIAIGDELVFLHPGSDVEITPIYSLDDNLFTNLTEWLYALGFQFTLFNVEFGGLAALGPGAAGVPLKFGVLEQTIPFFDSVVMNELYDTQFSMLGFDDVTGQTLRIGTLDTAAVPEPSTLWLVAIAVLGAGALRRRRVRGR